MSSTAAMGPGGLPPIKRTRCGRCSRAGTVAATRSRSTVRPAYTRASTRPPCSAAYRSSASGTRAHVRDRGASGRRRQGRQQRRMAWIVALSSHNTDPIQQSAMAARRSSALSDARRPPRATTIVAAPADPCRTSTTDVLVHPRGLAQEDRQIRTSAVWTTNHTGERFAPTAHQRMP